MEKRSFSPVELVLSTAMLLCSSAAAAQQCADHPVMDAYESSKDDRSWMEGLSSDNEAALEAGYNLLAGTAMDGLQAWMNSPIPPDLINNAGNFRRIANGDLLGGSLGIYGDTIGKLSPKLGNSLKNMWQGSIDGLAGRGENYAERETSKNESQANKSLRSSNCPTLDPYEEAHYVPRSGLCPALQLKDLMAHPAGELVTSYEMKNCQLFAIGNTPQSYFNASVAVKLFPNDSSARSAFDSAATDTPVKEGDFWVFRGENDAIATYLHRNMVVGIFVIRTPLLTRSEASATAGRAFDHFRPDEQ